MRGFVTAVRTLTILPCPGKDTEDFAAALPYFPIVGALIGGLVAFTIWPLARIGWWDGAGVAGTIAAAWLTRGLHLDGLADTVDALGGGRTLEKRLAIMKDPHTGAFGVLAIASVMLLKVVALARLAAAPCCGPLVAAPFIAARTAQVALAVLLPYARPEGGTAKGFVQNAKPAHLVVAALLSAALSFAVGRYWGLLTLAAALLMALLLAAWLRKTFGGVTGDLLGMASEVTETVLLVALAWVIGLEVE